METQTLQAEVRKQSGKGAARQLRAQGLLPAVIYGNGVEPLALAVSPKALTGTLSTEYGRNILLKLQIDGQEETAVVKDLQVDPVTRNILHVDFFRIDPARPIDIQVPITPQGRAKGVIRGGVLKALFRSLPVRCAADKVPAKIVIDVTNLDVNESIQVKDLQLEEGIQVQLKPERAVVTVVAESRRQAAATEAGQEEQAKS